MASKIQQQVLSALQQAGLNQNQARIFAAEIGRENSFNPDVIFGVHKDDSNGKQNVGMLSWQNGREKGLLSSLEKNGLIENGKIKQNQKALNIMANYAVYEIKSNPAYKQTKELFLDNPNVDYKTGSEILGKNYIRWRHDDPKYASGHTNRDEFYRQLGGVLPNGQPDARQRYVDRSAQIVSAYKENQKKLQQQQAPKKGASYEQIVSAYNQAKKNGTLPESPLGTPKTKPIDGLPNFDESGNFVPQTTADPMPLRQDTSITDDLLGVGEAGLTALTGATTGALGYMGGAAKGIGQSVLDGTFGTQEGAINAATAAQQGAESLTYMPRGQTGQDIVEGAGDILGTLPPVMGGMGVQAGILAKPATRVASQAAQPYVQQATNAVARPVQATANAVKSGVENMRNMVGMGRAPEGEASPANIGAAQVDQATIRNALAQDLPVPPRLTEGQLSRDPAQLKFEVETAKNPEMGVPLRQRYEEQHQAVQQSIDAFIDQTGSTMGQNLYDVGIATDKALQSRMQADKNRVRVAYAKADKSKEADASVDIVKPVQISEEQTASILDYLNSQPNLPTTPIIETAKKTAVSLGIVKRDKSGTFSADKPTVRQMEKWRQEINNAVDESAPNIRQATILKDMIDAHVEPYAGSLYKAARAERRHMAETWENHTIIKDLVNNKKGTDDRKTAFENVVNRVVYEGSLDDLRRAGRTIKRSGEEGKQAWKDIQGAVLQQIKDEATKNVAPDAQGNQMISPSALNKQITKLGDKLDYIFGKQGADKLRALNDVSKAIFTIPTSTAANHSNTAATIMAAMDMAVSGMSGFPAPVASALRIATRHIKDNKVKARVNRALNPQREPL